MERFDNNERRTLSVFIVIFFILTAGIVRSGYVYYRNYEKHYRTEVERQLSAIAELKADELVDWRKERLADAAVFYKNDNFSARVRQYLKTPGDPEARTNLRTWISQVKAANEYDRIFLLDTKGVERMSVPDKQEPVALHLLQHYPETLRSGQITFLDFHRDAPDRPIHLAILVPILDRQEGSRAIGLLVLKIDPQKYLYPFISRWPTPSKTGETLLVRREGNEVVFLNELKFQKNTALNLRISLERTETPAVQAVLGHQGIVEGKDYHGTPVLASVRAVPNSPWFLVALMDTSEVYTPLRERLWLMIFLICALLIGAGAGVGAAWRHQRAHFYRERYEASEELLAISSRQEAILSAVPDIIMEVDTNKVYTWANEAGKEFFGKDVVGREAAFYFEGEQELYETVKPLFNGNENVIYVESWQRRKDGQKRLLAWWCRVLKDKSGNVTGALSTARDITEIKRAEEVIRISEEKYRSLIENQTELVCRFKPDGTFIFVNDVYCHFFGKTKDELIGKKWFPIPLDEDIRFIEEKLLTLSPTNPIVIIENRVASSRGDIHWIQFVNRGFFDINGELLEIQSIGRDITDRKKAEEARRESDKLYHSLFVNMLNGLAYCKMLFEDGKPRDFIYLAVNDALESQSGLKDVVGRKVSEVIPGIRESDAQLLEIYGRVAMTGRPERFEMFIEALQMWYWVSVYSPEHEHFVAVFDVITERKRAEEVLRESEKRFRTLVESAPEAIFVQSQGCFVYLNPAMLRLLGASTPEELLGKEIMEQIALEYHEAIRERIRIQHETGKPAPLMEQEYLRIDGSRVPVETTAMAVRFQDRDAHLVFVRDITERKRAEEELRKLSRAVEQSPTSVIITDLHGDIEYVNPKFTEVTGYSLEEVWGKNPRILKSGETPPEEYRKLWKTITSGGEWHGVFHNKRKDGAYFWERASISAVRDSSGAITHFVAVKEDITNQKSLEDQFRQAQKMEAVGQLAGGIAHDFNNILTAIMGYGHLLQKKLKENDTLRTYADHILSLSDRAANLTLSLLAFSRKRTMNPLPVKLNEIIRKVEKLLVRIIGEDIQLQIQLSEEDLIIMADSGHIEQVLMNLATNARDAMPEGGLLTIGTETLNIDNEFIKSHGFGKEEKYALISLADSGAGMDMETREKIFEPFFTTKEVGKGTGLGLSMVYGIIKQHNGYINVYSEQGRGTTFRIYLPLIEAKVEDINPEVIPPVITGTETLLLAEDETEVREFTKNLLKEYGYKVITAIDGQDAINEFKVFEDKIQLVLLDVIMPNKNGKEVYDEIKQIKPDIKVLFMSGYPADIIQKHGIIEKGLAYIEKPVSPIKLLKKIREVLEE